MSLLVPCVYRTVVGPWTKLLAKKKRRRKKDLVEIKKFCCPKCGFCIEGVKYQSSSWTIREVGKLSQHKEECFKETQRTNTKLIKHIKTRNATKSNTEVSDLASKTFNMSLKTHSYDQSKYYTKKKEEIDILKDYAKYFLKETFLESFGLGINSLPDIELDKTSKLYLGYLVLLNLKTMDLVSAALLNETS